MSSGSALIYRFGDFELDLGRFELREHGQPKHLEPQVLSVLFLLVANSDRLVSKDEIIEQVWGGRFISDAAVASRIKAARQALGDDGQQQRFIRTLHGKGFRFAASVVFAHAEDGTRALPGDPPLIGQQVEDRPSIAVLPFKHAGEAGPLSFVAEALADELIADLSGCAGCSSSPADRHFAFAIAPSDARRSAPRWRYAIASPGRSRGPAMA